VDEQSLPFLEGCRIDYVEALNDSGFKVENPNASRSCGCGTSFEPKAD
jgi:iron-sulfur cluster assembly accessory protein